MGLLLRKLPENFRTITCVHLFRSERRPGLVVFDTRHHIGVYCGSSDHDGGASYRWVGLGHLRKTYPELNAVPELELPEEAELINGQWKVQPTAPLG